MSFEVDAVVLQVKPEDEAHDSLGADGFRQKVRIVESELASDRKREQSIFLEFRAFRSRGQRGK